VELKKIDHIGIAVNNLASAKAFYRERLGLAIEHEEAKGDMKIAFVPVGEVNIELIESTSEDGVIGKFISRRGEGVHHIAYEVDNIKDALKRLKNDGIRLIDEVPRRGAHGKKVAFLHPKDTNGVLTELVAKKPN